MHPLTNAIARYEEILPDVLEGEDLDDNETSFIVTDGETHVHCVMQPCHGSASYLGSDMLCRICKDNGMTSYGRGYVTCPYCPSAGAYQCKQERPTFVPTTIITDKCDREHPLSELTTEYLTKYSPITKYFVDMEEHSERYFGVRTDVPNNVMLFVIQCVRMSYGESLRGYGRRFGRILESGNVGNEDLWTAFLLNMMYDRNGDIVRYSHQPSDYMPFYNGRLSRKSGNRFLNLDFLTDMGTYKSFFEMSDEERRELLMANQDRRFGDRRSTPIKGAWALFHPSNTAERFCPEGEPDYEYYKEFLTPEFNINTVAANVDNLKAFLAGDI